MTFFIMVLNVFPELTIHCIRECVRVVQGRQCRGQLWQDASLGLLLSYIVGRLLGLVSLFNLASFDRWLIATVIAIGPVIGLIVGWFRSPSLHRTAMSIDQRCHLKDRTLSAIQFLERKNVGELSPIQQLQVTDAQQRLEAINPQVVAPIRLPRSWWSAIALATAACVLALISTKPSQVIRANQILTLGN